MKSVVTIIPVYNETVKNLFQAIYSALNQIGDFDHKIVVVDDGSTEDYTLIKNHFSIHDNVIFLRKENGGTASALNYGITHSTSDIIGWLSSDDQFYPEKTMIQLKFLQDPLSWSFSGFSIHNKVNVDYFAGEQFFSQFCNVQANAPMNEAIIRHFPNPCFVSGCSVLYNRELINKVGLFDERLTRTQDYDMWLRFSYVSDPFAIMNPLVLQNNDNPRKDDPKERELIKQRELLIIAEKKKHYSIGEFDASSK